MTFVIDADDIGKFPVGEIVDGVDLHGASIVGRVREVKCGNRVAIVVVERVGD